MKTYLALLVVAWGSISYASTGRLRLTIPAREIQVKMAPASLSIQPVYLEQFGVAWSFDLLSSTQVVEIEVEKPTGIIEKLSFHHIFRANRLLGVSSSRTPAQKADRNAWGVVVHKAVSYPGDIKELEGAREYGEADLVAVKKEVQLALGSKVSSFTKKLSNAQSSNDSVVLSLPLGSDEAVIEYPSEEKPAINVP
ncbi:MAG: hypothetical protein R3B54_00390 [Bdellovibrionota bacterium]